MPGSTSKKPIALAVRRHDVGTAHGHPVLVLPVKEGHAGAEPFTYRTARALFHGTGREVQVNLTVRRTPRAPRRVLSQTRQTDHSPGRVDHVDSPGPVASATGPHDAAAGVTEQQAGSRRLERRVRRRARDDVHDPVAGAVRRASPRHWRPDGRDLALTNRVARPGTTAQT